MTNSTYYQNPKDFLVVQQKQQQTNQTSAKPTIQQQPKIYYQPKDDYTKKDFQSSNLKNITQPAKPIKLMTYDDYKKATFQDLVRKPTFIQNKPQEPAFISENYMQSRRLDMDFSKPITQISPDLKDKRDYKKIDIDTPSNVQSAFLYMGSKTLAPDQKARAEGFIETNRYLESQSLPEFGLTKKDIYGDFVKWESDVDKGSNKIISKYTLNSNQLSKELQSKSDKYANELSKRTDITQEQKEQLLKEYNSNLTAEANKTLKDNSLLVEEKLNEYYKKMGLSAPTTGSSLGSKFEWYGNFRDRVIENKDNKDPFNHFLANILYSPVIEPKPFIRGAELGILTAGIGAFFPVGSALSYPLLNFGSKALTGQKILISLYGGSTAYRWGAGAYRGGSEGLSQSMGTTFSELSGFALGYKTTNPLFRNLRANLEIPRDYKIESGRGGALKDIKNTKQQGSLKLKEGTIFDDIQKSNIETMTGTKVKVKSGKNIKTYDVISQDKGSIYEMGDKSVRISKTNYIINGEPVKTTTKNTGIVAGGKGVQVSRTGLKSDIDLFKITPSDKTIVKQNGMKLEITQPTDVITYVAKNNRIGFQQVVEVPSTTKNPTTKSYAYSYESVTPKNWKKIYPDIEPPKTTASTIGNKVNPATWGKKGSTYSTITKTQPTTTTTPSKSQIVPLNEKGIINAVRSFEKVNFLSTLPQSNLWFLSNSAASQQSLSANRLKNNLLSNNQIKEPKSKVLEATIPQSILSTDNQLTPFITNAQTPIQRIEKMVSPAEETITSQLTDVVSPQIVPPQIFIPKLPILGFGGSFGDSRGYSRRKSYYQWTIQNPIRKIEESLYGTVKRGSKMLSNKKLKKIGDLL